MNNTKSAQEFERYALKHATEVLIYFKINDVSVDAFRQAKLNKPQVIPCFLRALWQLVILQLLKFNVCLNHTPIPIPEPACMLEVVQYHLFEWGYLFPRFYEKHVAEESSYQLFLAMVWLMAKSNIFDRYRSDIMKHYDNNKKDK